MGLAQRIAVPIPFPWPVLELAPGLVLALEPGQELGLVPEPGLLSLLVLGTELEVRPEPELVPVLEPV